MGSKFNSIVQLMVVVFLVVIMFQINAIQKTLNNIDWDVRNILAKVNR